MKTIGLIGGLSWESTADYYKYINTEIKHTLGGLHSAKILLHSFDFEEIVQLQQNGNWDEATKRMIEAGQTLEQAGADMIVICTNTMHKMAPELEKALAIPLLHIADATAMKIKETGLSTVALLGTKYTMEQDFYKERLENQGITVVTPDEEARNVIHNIIFNELCVGEIKDSSRSKYLEIMDALVEKGAEGMILGCTEIPLLIKQSHTDVPIFDTTQIHSEIAVAHSLK